MARIEEEEVQQQQQQQQQQQRVTTENSYQLLMEGKSELHVKKSEDCTDQLSVTKLLRDLYNKIYELESRIAKVDKIEAELQTLSLNKC